MFAVHGRLRHCPDEPALCCANKKHPSEKTQEELRGKSLGAETKKGQLYG